MTTEVTLNDKIVTLIEALGFSNTKFADTISVSRPTISHIISGRNKPSIDIIQKIMAVYPELGYKWFLDDESFDPNCLLELSKNQREDEMAENRQADNIITNSENVLLKNSPAYSSQTDATFLQHKTTTTRRVEKIIMFYSDGTMEVLAGVPQVL